MKSVQLILGCLICLSACTSEPKPIAQPTAVQPVATVAETTVPDPCPGVRRLKGVFYTGVIDQQTISVYAELVRGDTLVRIFEQNGDVLKGFKRAQDTAWKISRTEKEFPTDECPVTSTPNLVEKFDRAVRTLVNPSHLDQQIFTKKDQ